MMESCGIYQWNIIYARVRSVNINERIANEKAETKNSLGYVATFSNAFIISVYLYMYIYQIEHTEYLCYKHMTNWNNVPILNTGNKLYGSLIFNNDIIKLICRTIRYSVSIRKPNVIYMYISDDFQTKFTHQVTSLFKIL